MIRSVLISAAAALAAGLLALEVVTLWKQRIARRRISEAARKQQVAKICVVSNVTENQAVRSVDKLFGDFVGGLSVQATWLAQDDLHDQAGRFDCSGAVERAHLNCQQAIQHVADDTVPRGICFAVGICKVVVGADVKEFSKVDVITTSIFDVNSGVCGVGLSGQSQSALESNVIQLVCDSVAQALHSFHLQ